MDAVSFTPFRFNDRKVVAVIEEVLPAFGLAFAIDDMQRRWAVTRSTPGTGLQSLNEGRHVSLTISRQGGFEMATGYATLP